MSDNAKNVAAAVSSNERIRAKVGAIVDLAIECGAKDPAALAELVSDLVASNAKAKLGT